MATHVPLASFLIAGTYKREVKASLTTPTFSFSVEAKGTRKWR